MKNEKGFAMVLSLVLLLAMSLMGGALILISSGDHQSNNDSDQYQQTFYMAEMALLAGEQYLADQQAGPWDSKTNARDTTKKELEPGENIDGIGGFCSYGVAYPVSDSKGLAPLGLLEGGTVTKLIKAGDPISLESVELPENLINELRKKQKN